MSKLGHYLVLPKSTSAFEVRYLRRINRIALAFFWLHPPVFVVVAALAGTSKLLALVLSLLVMIGPTIAHVGLAHVPRTVSVIYGFTAMITAGVLVYVGQGPMQIEMHFYFFVLIAMLAVFGNPLVIVVAAVTVAAQHLVVWMIIPRAVFSYDATIWTVVVHALFVVIESIACCFVARSFFDNVLGLEEIVERRTAALDARNRDMALVLDNVGQGLVTVELDGALRGERSRVLAQWFGLPAPDTAIWSYLFAHDLDQAAWMHLAFETIREDILPLEVGLEQLPAKIQRDDRHYRLEYRPIGSPTRALLVVVSDVTDEIARQRAEGAERELLAVVERAGRDRTGFLAFVRDADRMVAAIAEDRAESLADSQRLIHTLKGNASLFGVDSVSEACHALEDLVEATGGKPSAADRANLVRTWRAFHERVERLLGLTRRRTLVVDWEEYAAVVAALEDPGPSWARSLRTWGQEATRGHLEQFAEQARLLAERLGKGALALEIEDHDVRLDGDRYAELWSAFSHAVRNAVDHGLETPEARIAAGKPSDGRLVFRTELVEDRLEIELRDDGAGVDWGAIARRASARGLPSSSPADLEAALFASGVSTAADVTDVSGRGIGMSALRVACANLGGTVRVISASGRGTRIVCEMRAA